jgi:hypothetical protein
MSVTIVACKKMRRRRRQEIVQLSESLQKTNFFFYLLKVNWKWPTETGQSILVSFTKPAMSQ